MAFVFGLAGGALAGMVGPAESARAAEKYGFDSITFGEHTHIPVNRRPTGAEPPPAMVRMFASQFDPFVAMTAAAVATTKLRVGTAVTLVPEHHPITMAKAVASIDQVSGGRVFLGVGAAWNEEVENHGVPFASRWAVTRERIAAMRTIWNNEEAEYHGKYVNFDPIWCDPKPVQPGGPPILLGSNSMRTIARVVDYADGWLPTADDLDGVAAGIAALREAAERKGREFASILIEPVVFGPTPESIERLIELGATKIHVGRLGPVKTGEADRAIEPLAEIVAPYSAS